MKLLLDFLSTAEAKCFLSVAHMKKKWFPTSKECKSKNSSVFVSVYTKVQEDGAAYSGKIWDDTSSWCAGYAHWTLIVSIRWPIRVESSPGWGLWEVCQGFQQDQDFNSSLYSNNISVSSALWGQHIWNTLEDTWTGESRVDPCTMRTSGCASSFHLCLVSSFIC